MILIIQLVLLFSSWLFEFVIRCFLRLFYTVRVTGLEHIPTEGGALIVGNHISWLDGFLVMYVSPRPVRMMLYRGNFQMRWIRNIAKDRGQILIENGPKKLVESLQEASAALRQGDLVGIFPEGGISRNSQLLGFRRGMLRILKGTNAPVIPVYLDELWGSVFSFEREKFFWKWPRRLRYPITIHIGKPIDDVKTVYQVRRAVQELGSDAVAQRQHRFYNLPDAFVRQCKHRKFTSKLADSSGEDLTGGMSLLRSLVLRRLLNRHVLLAEERRVGVLLPPSVGGALVNMALALDRRISVNLNYSVSSEVLNQIIQTAGIKHVLTSRRVMSKLNLQLDAELVYLEDFKDKVTFGDKGIAGLATYLVPRWFITRCLRLHQITPDDLATLVFTSGSTGTPKGVMLTYGNVAANVEAIRTAIHLRPTDIAAGILPFFHSFGYTVTLWTPMACDMKAAYHYSPLDGRGVGRMIERQGATIILSTATFLRAYLRRCTKQQLATLSVVVAGAEKLPIALCDRFEEKFGVRPVEGYGCTELSPLASVNVPASRARSEIHAESREGTVGRPVPYVTAKITDLDSGQELGAEQSGMLWIKGPNVMKGYLDQPEKTSEVLVDGWYRTGDVALIDADGFIRITGRVSRFSKIGGEMVPHVHIEEMLAEIIGADEEKGIVAVVTAVPHEKKGERLVVLHEPIPLSTDALCQGLSERGLPNLYIPSADSFFEVPKLPLLGTGKLDLRMIKQMAMEKVAK